MLPENSHSHIIEAHQNRLDMAVKTKSNNPAPPTDAACSVIALQHMTVLKCGVSRETLRSNTGHHVIEHSVQSAFGTQSVQQLL